MSFSMPARPERTSWRRICWNRPSAGTPLAPASLLPISWHAAGRQKHSTAAVSVRWTLKTLPQKREGTPLTIFSTSDSGLTSWISSQQLLCFRLSVQHPKTRWISTKNRGKTDLKAVTLNIGRIRGQKSHRRSRKFERREACYGP